MAVNTQSGAGSTLEPFMDAKGLHSQVLGARLLQLCSRCRHTVNLARCVTLATLAEMLLTYYDSSSQPALLPTYINTLSPSETEHASVCTCDWCAGVNGDGRHSACDRMHVCGPTGRLDR